MYICVCTHTHTQNIAFEETQPGRCVFLHGSPWFLSKIPTMPLGTRLDEASAMGKLLFTALAGSN